VVLVVVFFETGSSCYLVAIQGVSEKMSDKNQGGE